MINLIGMSLEKAIDDLSEKGLKFEIVYNNSNKQKEKDCVLVVNAKEKNGAIVLYVSDFLLTVR